MLRAIVLVLPEIVIMLYLVAIGSVSLLSPPSALFAALEIAPLLGLTLLQRGKTRALQEEEILLIFLSLSQQ